MFQAGSVYCGLDAFKHDLNLYVISLSADSSAVFGVVFDDTFAVLSRRWFRVARRGFAYVCHGRNCIFKSGDFSACVPPPEVLDYFRNSINLNYQKSKGAKP